METLKYAVALSLMSSSLWPLYSKHDPQTIYDELISPDQRKIQEYLTKWYSGSVLDEACRIIDMCMKMKISIITYWDTEYPSLLREIVYPPAVLFCKGNFIHSLCISVVGTRNADQKSSSIARRLSEALARSGITIVSGIALGIDREAHYGALHVGGSTVAVLANGIDLMYPASNRDLYTDILRSECGCIISEYPPKVMVTKWTFVRRNRIISGLSLATIVVKAGEKSGALITARYAIEQNRELFVCLGHTFDEGYKGCYSLLKQGANPVFDEHDVLEVLKIAAPHGVSVSHKDLNNAKNVSMIETYEEDNDDIIIALKECPRDIDVLVRVTGKSIAEVLERISILELKGIVTRSGNIVSLVR